MKIMVYSDCMSIAPSNMEDENKYSGILQKRYFGSEVLTKGYTGETSRKACENIDDVIKQNPDLVILGWGVNDALPRGLKRKTRSRIIKSMYSLRFNTKLRLLSRKIFLNPLEYIMQKIHKPYFYIAAEETEHNFNKMITDIKMETQCKEIFVVAITPILNYRFIDANVHIQAYNSVIKRVCDKRGVTFIDLYSAFKKKGIKECLDYDLFHYGVLGHKIAAEEIIYNIDKRFSEVNTI